MSPTELPIEREASPIELLRARVAAAEEEVRRQRERLSATMSAMEQDEQKPDLLGRFFR